MMALNSMSSCSHEETYQIRKSVLYYLLKSKLNCSSSKIQCPFDALHMIDEEYIEHHIFNCASSGNVETKLYNIQSVHQVGSVPLEAVKQLHVPLMEDWQEENVQMYDPWKSTETRNIIRCLMGGTKSERRLFKFSERRRIEYLKKRSIIDANLRNNFRKSKKYISASWLIRDLKKLALEDFDALLKNIDISKLFISDDDKVVETKQESDTVEQLLTQKFKKLVLCCLKKEVS